MTKPKAPPGQAAKRKFHHSQQVISVANKNFSAMNQVKIKRVKRNKKKVTTKEKILAGLGVGGSLLGGASSLAQKPQQNTQYVRTQEKNNPATFIKQNLAKIFQKGFENTVGAKSAKADFSSYTGEGDYEEGKYYYFGDYGGWFEYLGSDPDRNDSWNGPYGSDPSAVGASVSEIRPNQLTYTVEFGHPFIDPGAVVFYTDRSTTTIYLDQTPTTSGNYTYHEGGMSANMTVIFESASSSYTVGQEYLKDFGDGSYNYRYEGIYPDLRGSWYLVDGQRTEYQGHNWISENNDWTDLGPVDPGNYPSSVRVTSQATNSDGSYNIGNIWQVEFTGTPGQYVYDDKGKSYGNIGNDHTLNGSGSFTEAGNLSYTFYVGGNSGDSINFTVKDDTLITSYIQGQTYSMNFGDGTYNYTYQGDDPRNRNNWYLVDGQTAVYNGHNWMSEYNDWKDLGPVGGTGTTAKTSQSVSIDNYSDGATFFIKQNGQSFSIPRATVIYSDGTSGNIAGQDYHVEGNNQVDLSAPVGTTYRLTYAAVDGKSSPVYLNVQISADTVVRNLSITPIQSGQTQVEPGWADPGAAVLDSQGNVVVQHISSDEISVPLMVAVGSQFTFHYNYTDPETGKAYSAIRTVTVKNTASPRVAQSIVINGYGSNDVYNIEQGTNLTLDAFPDAMVTYSDGTPPGLSLRWVDYTITGVESINTSAAVGTQYAVTYTSADGKVSAILKVKISAKAGTNTQTTPPGDYNGVHIFWSQKEDGTYEGIGTDKKIYYFDPATGKVTVEPDANPTAGVINILGVKEGQVIHISTSATESDLPVISATGSDSKPANLKRSSGEVKFGTPGAYVISKTFADSFGNEATVHYMVIVDAVLSDPKIAPTIIGVKEGQTFHIAFSANMTFGIYVSATDAYGANLKIETSGDTIKYHAPGGIYKQTVTATDSWGHVTTVNYYVEVDAPTKIEMPFIGVQDGAMLTVDNFEDFNPAVTAEDCFGNKLNFLATLKAIDSFHQDRIYSATDQWGNTTVATVHLSKTSTEDAVKLAKAAALDAQAKAKIVDDAYTDIKAFLVKANDAKNDKILDSKQKKVDAINAILNDANQKLLAAQSALADIQKDVDIAAADTDSAKAVASYLNSAKTDYQNAELAVNGIQKMLTDVQSSGIKGVINNPKTKKGIQKIGIAVITGNPITAVAGVIDILKGNENKTYQGTTCSDGSTLWEIWSGVFMDGDTGDLYTWDSKTQQFIGTGMNITQLDTKTKGSTPDVTGYTALGDGTYYDKNGKVYTVGIDGSMVATGISIKPSNPNDPNGVTTTPGTVGGVVNKGIGLFRKVGLGASAAGGYSGGGDGASQGDSTAGTNGDFAPPPAAEPASGIVDTTLLAVTSADVTPTGTTGEVFINGEPVAVTVSNGVVYGPDNLAAGASGGVLANLNTGDSAQIIEAFQSALPLPSGNLLANISTSNVNGKTVYTAAVVDAAGSPVSVIPPVTASSFAALAGAIQQYNTGSSNGQRVFSALSKSVSNFSANNAGNNAALADTGLTMSQLQTASAGNSPAATGGGSQVGTYSSGSGANTQSGNVILANLNARQPAAGLQMPQEHQASSGLQMPNSTAQVQAASTAGNTSYVVKRGDTLWSIAKQYYGDGRKWRVILEANTKKITSPKALKVGTVLEIPNL